MSSETWVRGSGADVSLLGDTRSERGLPRTLREDRPGQAPGRSGVPAVHSHPLGDRERSCASPLPAMEELDLLLKQCY